MKVPKGHMHCWDIRNTVHYLECACGAKLPTGFKFACEECNDIGWFWVDKWADTRKECNAPGCEAGRKYKEDPRYLKHLPKDTLP